MAGRGFHRDIANSELDIQVGGTVVMSFGASATTFPASTITLEGRTSVEQTGNHATAVTGADSTSGTILLDNADLAAGVEAQFTVACNKVAANDTVLLCVGDYVDEAAAPVVSIIDVGAGTFSVLLSNPSSVNTFNACKLNWAIIKSVS